MSSGSLRLALALSPAQAEFLKRIAGGALTGAPFSVGDSLRKRGLLERYTTFVTSAEYAHGDEVTTQYKNRTPVPHHEWWITGNGLIIADLLK